MPVPSYIDNHTELSYERLLGQFKEKPVIQGVLATWSDKIQELENDIYDLMTETLFLNAEGENLQRYGQLLGIPRPEGISDGVYRELLIAEILRRSSDGSPDRIRQIIESTTGMRGMRFFEHFNANQLPTVMGAIFTYGYADPDIVTFRVDAEEAKYVKWASPVTTGSVVLGQHLYGESSLFIPSELEAGLDTLGVVSPTDFPTTDELVNETDDFIALQTSFFGQTGVGADNAILPEFTGGTDRFQVDTLTTGIEDFNVDTILGVEEFDVDIARAASNEKGIMLEISQITLTEAA